ncbi:MAG: polysaccharide biosynthesis C-terminal domain-containing protein, partial [Candidatus Cloacimonetes bacterium]|nr:polysaccharide biosynthesis C-terminal domain-containing protein [Candidatus Cloacimonadota bacterium]
NLSFVLFILAGTLWRGLSLNLIFQVMLFSSLVTSGAVLFWLRKLLHSFTVKADQRKLFSSDLMAKVLGFGLIMIPGTLAMMVLRISDRYMLTWLSPRGLYDVGIYAIGYRIGMILSFLTSLFSMVYFPYAMKIASNDNPEITYRRFFKLYSLTGGILGFAIILLAAEIFSIFIDRSYHEGIRIVFAGVVSCYLTGIFNMINISFYIRQKARHIALTVGAGAILNIVLNYFAIPRYGFYGAGIASIIAYLTIVIVNYIISEKMYRIGYQVSGMVISLAAMLIISLLNFITLNTGYISLIKLGILAFIVLIFGRYLLFTGRELALLKRYLQGNRNVPE